MSAEVESIFDRRALLQGRATALKDIKRAMRDREWLRAVLSFCLVDRAKVTRKVLDKTRDLAGFRGYSEHELASFVAGYCDAIEAFGRVYTS